MLQETVSLLTFNWIELFYIGILQREFRSIRLHYWLNPSRDSLFMDVRLMSDLRPLFFHVWWRRNCAKFDWKNLVLLGSVFGDVSCRGYRPPLILVFTAFYVLVFSTILIFDDFGLFPVQLMNIFYYEIRAFHRSIQRLSFNVPCLIKRRLLLTIWTWFTLSALSGYSLLGF